MNSEPASLSSAIPVAPSPQLTVSRAAQPSPDVTPETPASAPCAPRSEDNVKSRPESPTPRRRRRRRPRKTVPRGRPSTFSSEIADAIFQTILDAGLTDSRAALLSGVSTSTVSRWKQQNPNFADFLGVARARFHAAQLQKLSRRKLRTGADRVRIAKWLLKQSNPAVYGPPRSKLPPRTRRRRKTSTPTKAPASQPTAAVGNRRPQQPGKYNGLQSKFVPIIPIIPPAEGILASLLSRAINGA